MALPCSIRDREYLKFELDENGDVCVRVCGDFTPLGLGVGGKITEITLNSATWTAIPAVALTNRNGMGIQNTTNRNIKINFVDTEPGFVGWQVSANGELFLDVKPAVTIYAKAQSGTPIITAMEVA